MQGRALAEILLRLWGLWLLISAFAGLPHAIGWFLRAHDSGPYSSDLLRASVISLGLTAAIPLLQGIFCLACARVLARWVVPESTPMAIGTNATELMVIGLTLLGVYILVSGLANLVGGFYIVTTVGSDSTWISRRETLVTSSVQFAAGILILLGRRGIASGISILRGEREQPTG